MGVRADSEQESASRGPVPAGRPGGLPPGPSAATAYAVLSQAWRILADEGLVALTPMRLHRETGVARTTIYRHWPDTAALVNALVERQGRAGAVPEPTGDLHADLGAAVEALVSTLRRRPVGRLVGALLAAATPADSGQPPPSADVYVALLVGPTRELVEAAIIDGRLHGSVGDADRAVADLIGPILMEVVLRGADADHVDTGTTVADFLTRWAR